MGQGGRDEPVGESHKKASRDRAGGRRPDDEDDASDRLGTAKRDEPVGESHMEVSAHVENRRQRIKGLMSRTTRHRGFKESPPEERGLTMGTGPTRRHGRVPPVGETPTKASKDCRQRTEPDDRKGSLKGQPREVTTRGQWLKGDDREELSRIVVRGRGLTTVKRAMYCDVV